MLLAFLLVISDNIFKLLKTKNMKTVDLRIGNWANTPNGIMMCVGILCDSVNFIDEYSVIHNFGIDDIDGIPLTPEVFGRCEGFYMDKKAPQMNGHSDFYSLDLFDFKYSFSFATFREDWGFYHSYTDAGNDADNNRFDFISCGIQHVHKLQNLILDLTGKELKYKLCTTK